MRIRRPRLVFLTALLLYPLGLLAQNTGQVYGRVQTLGADGEPLYLVGAQLVLTAQTDPGVRYETLSDPTGAYSFAALPPGRYTLEATLKGYEKLVQEVVVEAAVLQEITLTLRLEAVREEVTVRGETEGVQPEETTPKTELQSSVYENAALASERFLDALPLVPGVVRGADGLIRIKGARSTETGWLVNSANVTDPVTGEQAISLPVDVIQEVEVLPNPYAAEYGKFAGAVTTVETKPSTQKFSFKLNNFVPRLRRRGGSVRGVESATPRVTFSGPLRKDKLAFLQSFEYRLTRAPVTSLPELERDTDIESFDSFTQFDATFNPNHLLTAVFSLYPQKNRFATLNTFNPQPVTANYRQRGWMAGGRDHYIFMSGALLESTFSIKDFDADIFPARVGESFIPPPVCDPTGTLTGPSAAFILRPQCNFGQFFNTQNRISRRTEWMEVYNFAPRQARGQHLLKLGFNLSRNTFRGLHASRTVEVRRRDNSLAERIEFLGASGLARNKTELTLFLHDKWNLHRRLTLDVGVRYDYNTLAQENNVAPRLAFSYMLTEDGRTVLRSGIGLFYDKVPLNVGTFPQLQQRVVTRFAADGVTPVDGPRTFVNRLENIRNPRSLAFNLELNREITGGLVLRLGYLQREGRNEYVVEPFDSLAGVPTLLLAARGRSRYREFQVTANHRFREDSFLNISYVHSESAGDLNNFQEFFGNFENPIIRANERTRLRFDVPDRLLIWGEIELLWGVRWSPLLDWRSGFPFSRVDENQNFVGARNQGGRFPPFASFDSQVFKDFKVKAFGKVRKLRLGLKIFNILDHFNPRDVQQNIDAFNSLGFFNARGRLFRGKLSIGF